MQRLSSSIAALLLIAGCSKQAGDASPPDPTAGKARATIFYSGNLWGDLVECG